ncbi:MAG: helix-turn-helix domain-containing protein [Gemmatimonadales bacterium]
MAGQHPRAAECARAGRALERSAGARLADLHFDGADLAPRSGAGDGPPRAADPLEHFATLAELERHHIGRALQLAGGKVAEAAKLLGVPRSTLYQRLKALGIPSSRS